MISTEHLDRASSHSIPSTPEERRWPRRLILRTGRLKRGIRIRLAGSVQCGIRQAAAGRAMGAGGSRERSREELPETSETAPLVMLVLLVLRSAADLQ